MHQRTSAKAWGTVVILALSSWATAATASVNIPFKSPTDKPAPRRASTSQGASRGELCGQSAQTAPISVKALLPDSHYGLTAAERPTIVAYLPATSATEVFFSIKDEAKQLHFSTHVPISGQAGLVSLTLPEQAPALEAGEELPVVFGREVQWKAAAQQSLCRGLDSENRTRLYRYIRAHAAAFHHQSRIFGRIRPVVRHHRNAGAAKAAAP